MRTEKLEIHLEEPLDFPAAIAALAKIQKGVQELSILLRKEVHKQRRQKGSTTKHRVLR